MMKSSNNMAQICLVFITVNMATVIKMMNIFDTSEMKSSSSLCGHLSVCAVCVWAYTPCCVLVNNYGQSWSPWTRTRSKSAKGHWEDGCCRVRERALAPLVGGCFSLLLCAIWPCLNSCGSWSARPLSTSHQSMSAWVYGATPYRSRVETSFNTASDMSEGGRSHLWTWWSGLSDVVSCSNFITPASIMTLFFYFIIMSPKLHFHCSHVNYHFLMWHPYYLLLLMLLQQSKIPHCMANHIISHSFRCCSKSHSFVLNWSC